MFLSYYYVAPFPYSTLGVTKTIYLRHLLQRQRLAHHRLNTVPGSCSNGPRVTSSDNTLGIDMVFQHASSVTNFVLCRTVASTSMCARMTVLVVHCSTAVHVRVATRSKTMFEDYLRWHTMLALTVTTSSFRITNFASCLLIATEISTRGSSRFVLRYLLECICS